MILYRYIFTEFYRCNVWHHRDLFIFVQMIFNKEMCVDFFMPAKNSGWIYSGKYTGGINKRYTCYEIVMARH